MNAEPRQFLDTNVLVYVWDSSDPMKEARAQRLVDELGPAGRIVVSIQVLQELYVTLARKLAPPHAAVDASTVVQQVSGYRTHCPTPDDVNAAIDLSITSHISFWDAMLVRSASRLNCDVLWTEDLTHGQNIAGVEIRNPFQS